MPRHSRRHAGQPQEGESEAREERARAVNQSVSSSQFSRGAHRSVAGLTEIVGAFWSRGWSGFFLHVLSGVLSLVIGALCLKVPVDALLALTLLVECLLMVGGIFKIVAASSHRFEAWGWPLVSGVIDLILGVLIWLEWPASALWVLGLFVGISLVFRGFNWIGLGLVLRVQRPRRDNRSNGITYFGR